MSANLIAQQLYSETDEEGKEHVLLDDIVDHKRSDNAVNREDAFIIMKNGVKRRRETTQVGSCCVNGRTALPIGWLSRT